MSMGKGGEQTQKVELPKEIQAAAKENLALADRVGSLPYAPYFGASVAGFTPGQDAAFNNMNSAASAFGLQGNAGQGMPKPNATTMGINGYSTEPVYNDAMAQVDPRVLELYKSFFYPNNTAPGVENQQQVQQQRMREVPNSMPPGSLRFVDPVYGGNFRSYGAGK